MKALPHSFFASDTVEVAQRLVGKVLVVHGMKGRIVETEAYRENDPASHCFRRTARSALMFDTYGHAYVYLIYGMYHCLNVTTERNKGGAVLIRALEPLESITGKCDGPGKLCRSLKIGLSLNGQKIGDTVRILDDGFVPSTIETSARIGITKATDVPWRFFLKGNPYVSRGKR